MSIAATLACRPAGFALALLLLVCGSGRAQPPGQSMGHDALPPTRASATEAGHDPAQDEREIRRVEAEICQAFLRGDAATLRPLLDDGFILTSSTGVVTDLAQNLEEVRTRDPAYDEFRNHDQIVRLHGDAAIVTGITTVKGRSGGESFAKDFQFTDTWVRRDGRWLLAASHASALAGR